MVTNPATCSPDDTLAESTSCARATASPAPRSSTARASGRHRHQPRHAVRVRPLPAVRDVMTPMPLVTGRSASRATTPSPCCASTRSRSCRSSTRRPAHRADHGQGLREVRAVPAGHQGRGRPARRRCGGRRRRGVDKRAAPPWSTPGVDLIIVDTAHGHSRRCSRWSRGSSATRHVDIVGGNIATREGAQALVDAGADGVKVGVGPGSICTTRVVAGVGVPRSPRSTRPPWRKPGRRPGDRRRRAAVLRRHRQGDGGRRRHGDARLAAGRLRRVPGRADLHQRQAVQGLPRHGLARARCSRATAPSRTPRTATSRRTSLSDDKLVPEGIEGQVPYRGPLAAVAHQLVGGLRQSMGYVGAPRSPSCRPAAGSIRITPAGLKESHPHDIQMTIEAPNYSSR
jgi:IMP dehydrogenase